MKSVIEFKNVSTDVKVTTETIMQKQYELKEGKKEEEEKKALHIFFV